MSGFISYPYFVPEGGEFLIRNETDGLGVDFTYQNDTTKQMVIRDTTTPANNYTGAADTTKLTYTTPSPKWTLRASGLWAATNGSTDMPFEWDTSGNLLGLLIEGGRVNLCLQSDDMTNASWTKTTMTTSKTATGANGTANAATICTASGANATCLQAIVSASSIRITSMFVKRRTGSGTINITQDNGTTWTVVTVTSAWTQVQSTSQTLTNPTVGFRIVTSGDAIDVMWFLHETGSQANRCSSPIPTTTTSVTRNTDKIDLLQSAFPSMRGPASWIIEWQQKVAVPSGGFPNAMSIWTTGGHNDAATIYANDAGGRWSMDMWSGAVVQADINTTGVLTTTTGIIKGGGAWNTNDVAWVTNAGSAGTDVAATRPASLTTLSFGYNGGVGGAAIFGYLRKVTMVPRRMSNAELQARTT